MKWRYADNRAYLYDEQDNLQGVVCYLGASWYAAVTSWAQGTPSFKDLEA